MIYPSWIERMQAARAVTLDWVARLDDEQLRAQPHPDFSPIGWHLGHVAFTEAQWVLGRIAGATDWKRHARQWAQDGCPKHERVAQPAKAEILAYLAHVRERAVAVLRECDERSERPLERDGFIAWFVLAHELQHRETMQVVASLAGMPSASRVAIAATDAVERLDDRLGHDDARPALEAEASRVAIAATDAVERLDDRLAHDDERPALEAEASRVSIAATDAAIGTDDRLAYDNERPAHRVALASFAIDRAPATIADWRAFVADDGYARRELWTADGWAWRRAHDITSPRGLRSSAASAAVCGISWFEADAYARWRGARLPTEAEWEVAARTGSLARTGEVWEWTASSFAPYPGFRAFPYRGYSTPYFDGAHRVLRGGSHATDPSIARPTFRNFYLPHVREIFAGVRCAR